MPVIDFLENADIDPEKKAFLDKQRREHGVISQLGEETRPVTDIQEDMDRRIAASEYDDEIPNNERPLAWWQKILHVIADLADRLADRL